MPFLSIELFCHYYVCVLSESLPYRVHPETGLIDYDALAAQAALYKPALIVCGGSAYPREFDYARFRQIADDNGALLMMDMAHISGLVATGEAVSPFDLCDIVTTTTHKSLRGPRGAMFPGLQGGPHEHQIAAIATQLKEVCTPEFKAYAKQVRSNARRLAEHLQSHNYVLATGGTDNHLILWDLKPQGITGAKMQVLCDHCSITLNKNTVLGDTSALTPGGVRIGTPALTTRGLKEEDFCTVGEFLHRAVTIAISIQASLPSKLLKDFEAAVKVSEEVKALKMDVMRWITTFPMPGFDITRLDGIVRILASQGRVNLRDSGLVVVHPCLGIA